MLWKQLLRGAGCTGNGAAAPGKLRTEGSSSPGLQLWKQFPRSRGEHAKSVATQNVTK